jgi:hypothetical protein
VRLVKKVYPLLRPACASARTRRPCDMSSLILKRGSASRRRDDDYDVLEDGVVVGRIFMVPTAPQGRPWMWASGHSAATVKRAAHGYEPTREAAMAAFAKSWRRD